MSATGRSNCRQPDDYYATPAWCTRAILRQLQRPAPGSVVLDPCCGKGAILDVVKEVWPDVRTVGYEIDEHRAATAMEKGHLVRVCDALALHHFNEYWPVLIVQNTPFKLGMDFVRRSIASANTVVSLHRHGFLASKERAQFWRTTEAFLHFLPKRPSFAASVKCKAHGCGWAQTFEVDAELPRSCPACSSSGLAVCRSDSADYVWIRFGGVGRGWEILEVGE